MKQVDEKGNICWFKNGTEILHREDGPAIECYDGQKYWYVDGQLHRDGAPAWECPNGSRHWFYKDQYHREDGPAAEYTVDVATGKSDGWKYDKYVSKIWYNHGKYHREDGPAVEYVNGDKEWYYNGVKVNCSSQEEFEQSVKTEGVLVV